MPPRRRGRGPRAASRSRACAWAGSEATGDRLRPRGAQGGQACLPSPEGSSPAGRTGKGLEAESPLCSQRTGGGRGAAARDSAVVTVTFTGAAPVQSPGVGLILTPPLLGAGLPPRCPAAEDRQVRETRETQNRTLCVDVSSVLSWTRRPAWPWPAPSLMATSPHLPPDRPPPRGLPRRSPDNAHRGSGGPEGSCASLTPRRPAGRPPSHPRARLGASLPRSAAESRRAPPRVGVRPSPVPRAAPGVRPSPVPGAVRAAEPRSSAERARELGVEGTAVTEVRARGGLACNSCRREGSGQDRPGPPTLWGVCTGRRARTRSEGGVPGRPAPPLTASESSPDPEQMVESSVLTRPGLALPVLSLREEASRGRGALEPLPCQRGLGSWVPRARPSAPPSHPWALGRPWSPGKMSAGQPPPEEPPAPQPHSPSATATEIALLMVGLGTQKVPEMSAPQDDDKCW
ncbi:translation initiation factor IF-2-like [Perognathus longimembris pacificus]|uniref:translation initiation factor IF-2-like n=1 Tax=Perognathus longimembris pacificus TaxID=214514 RepID=UPI0020192872|nr:translation initiation factor IF-2-like [Perognathus longimembris pacificus]